MVDLKLFLKSYWEYYLELEEQLIETKRFVAFDKANAKAFSIEYLKLYQAVCSEIDVVGKEIASAVNPSFKIDNNTNIKKWGYEVQQHFPLLKDRKVLFVGEEIFQPFKNWEYEYNTISTKKGTRSELRIKDAKETMVWWRNYNEIKHRRIGLVEGTKNFQLANQQNLIQAFAALYILETLYIEELESKEKANRHGSRLFKMVTPAGEEDRK